MTALDCARCPLCGGPNDCGQQQGRPKCWCYSIHVSEEALSRVPEEAQNKACLCRACATGKTSPTHFEEMIKELHRRR